MSNHSYIKYLTEEFVSYINKTPIERKQDKRTKKNDSIFSSHLFGLIPFMVKYVFKKSA